ncbi:MAG: CoA transferase [Phenylobacterium sp.]|uniref:CoA transferase n=1 Tax=Phenylobacterium sp. TaxID=1871053 RepID=UPI001A49C197|nr:CoA transferase [Phenylobacterium sp.]MBL8555372.1 CoA transferase [Phenylobacterium sp.]
MRDFDAVLASLSARIARLSARLGARVDVAAMEITARTGLLPLDPPTRISPNRACRMVRAADGWIAVNLAREEDRDLVPAWLEGAWGEPAWDQVERLAPTRTVARLREDGVRLGLPVGAVGEVSAARPQAGTQAYWPGRSRSGPPTVIDLSALWAGPMCGAILAAAGCEVTKVESLARPDPTRTSTPEFHRRLNGAKRERTVDLADPAGRAALREAVLAADVVITGARPRAFAALGFEPREITEGGAVWVAITGHGWAAGHRVAFGDDAAAAGGLVRWTEAGEPQFLGDALADPVTGLAASVGALEALTGGGAVRVDAGLAPCAAGAAGLMGLARAA